MSRTVSVLMPVLNEERSVVGAVHSARAQEECNPYVIVADGRSFDRTREIVTELARDDERVQLVDNPRVIISAGLNAALEAANSDFVARIDGHASVNERYLAIALARLEADPTLGGIGGQRHGVAGTRVGRAIAAALSSPFGVGNSINHYATAYQLTDHASFGVYRAEAALSLIHI